MKSSDVRRKFIEFFVRRRHKEIPSASLVPKNDPTTLFTSSGMQPLIAYILGEKHPDGKRLVNSQRSFRAQDIDEVGDNRHTTFFEMLGNWSLGDYFKKDQLTWLFEFLTKELRLDPKRLYVSVFEGNDAVPKDSDSISIWKTLFSKVGIDAREGERIFTYPADKNWWSRSGEPDSMPPGEPGGPSSEVFFDFGEQRKIHESSKYKNKKCHLNCDCGRYMEIANSVFMQYKKQKDGSLRELEQQIVDFGGGLERLVAVTQDDPDIFLIDTFRPIIQKIEEATTKKYSNEKNKSTMRIVADHIKAATFLIVDGVVPSNKGQGYVLRRLLRRASVEFARLRENTEEYLPPGLSTIVLKIYDGVDTIDKNKQESRVYKTIEEEIRKFQKTLHKGLNILQKIDIVDGKKAFDLYQTYGFPLEVTIELLKQKGKHLDAKDFKREFAKHRELSRAASKGMFKGGLADHSEQTTKLHTATHLVHQALRAVLGDHVVQKGSNITASRLRFDFSHSSKMSQEERKKVEGLVNEKIKENLPVTFEIMDTEEAQEAGALAFFGERYGKKVKVYTIGDPEKGTVFSREICGGPHVDFTGVLGHFTITKEESAGAGVRRLYATVIK